MARRPEISRITSTIRAMASNRWINPPPKLVAAPRAHNRTRTTISVHNIGSILSWRAAGDHRRRAAPDERRSGLHICVKDHSRTGLTKWVDHPSRGSGWAPYEGEEKVQRGYTGRSLLAVPARISGLAGKQGASSRRPYATRRTRPIPAPACRVQTSATSRLAKTTHPLSFRVG